MHSRRASITHINHVYPGNFKGAFEAVVCIPGHRTVDCSIAGILRAVLVALSYGRIPWRHFKMRG